MCVLMYKCLNEQGPAFLQDTFTFVNHGFSMRAETFHKVTVPKCNVDLFKQCLTYQGPKLWNNLPDNLKNFGSVHTFNV